MSPEGHPISSMFHNIDFEVPDNLISFCKVVIGGSITLVSNSFTIPHGTLLEVQTIDLLVNYISTFITWSVGTLTSLVAIKTLSGKSSIIEAFRYFKNGFNNLFKKKK